MKHESNVTCVFFAACATCSLPPPSPFSSFSTGLAFVEEILPGFDIIPTATIAWFLSEWVSSLKFSAGECSGRKLHTYLPYPQSSFWVDICILMYKAMFLGSSPCRTRKCRHKACEQNERTEMGGRTHRGSLFPHPLP